MITDEQYIAAFKAVFFADYDACTVNFRRSPSAGNFSALYVAMIAVQFISQRDHHEWAIANLKDAGVGKWVDIVNQHVGQMIDDEDTGVKP